MQANSLTNASTDHIRLPTALKAFVWTVISLTVLSFVVAVEHQQRGLWQTGLHVLAPYPIAFDYFAYIHRFQYLHSREFFTYNGYLNFRVYYPAPGMLVYYPFYLLDSHSTFAATAHSLRGMTALRGYRVYLVTTLALVSGLGILFRRALIREGLTSGAATIFAGVSLFTAYPIYFALQRGNIEALTWMLLAVAIWAFSQRHDMTAATLIGIAASIKIYPVLFLGLYLKRGGLKAWAVAFASSVGLTIFALWVLDPHVVESARYIARGIHSWTLDYGEVYQNQYDHSAFGLVKWFTHAHTPDYLKEFHRYLVAAGSLAALLYLRVRNLPATNQILFLSSAVVLLPPGSFDYTLCLLYVPLAWLAVLTVRAARNRAISSWITGAMVLLGCIIPPDVFLNFTELNGNPGAFKAACLIGLLAISLISPLYSEKIEALAPAVHTSMPGGREVLV